MSAKKSGKLLTRFSTLSLNIISPTLLGLKIEKAAKDNQLLALNPNIAQKLSARHLTFGNFMQRKIKFRLWCKVNNEFVDPKTLGGILNYRYNGSLNSIFEDDSIEFQQFTGLLDKNGVEIYEGDIVTYFPQLNSTEAKCEVVSCVGGFRLARLHSKKGVLLGAFVEIEGKVNSLKVIGNIFENPELAGN